MMLAFPMPGDSLQDYYDTIPFGDAYRFEDEQVAHDQSFDDSEQDAVVDLALTLSEWSALRLWIDTHGYTQSPVETVEEWRVRTGPIAYAYSRMLSLLGDIDD